jgi:hypothetical protein
MRQHHREREPFRLPGLFTLPVVETSSVLAASLPPDLTASAFHAMFSAGSRWATSLRVARERCLPACAKGLKSSSLCEPPGRPVNTRSPSGNITMSPGRKVLSARRAGTGLAISPAAFGSIGFFISGCSTQQALDVVEPCVWAGLQDWAGTRIVGLPGVRQRAERRL